VHSEHYDSILNIPTVLELHSRCIRVHLERARIIRCGFAANSYYSNGILKKSLFNEISAIVQNVDIRTANFSNDNVPIRLSYNLQ